MYLKIVAASALVLGLATSAMAQTIRVPGSSNMNGMGTTGRFVQPPVGSPGGGAFSRFSTDPTTTGSTTNNGEINLHSHGRTIGHGGTYQPDTDCTTDTGSGILTCQ